MILSREVEWKPQPRVLGRLTDSEWGRLGPMMLVPATNMLDKLSGTKLHPNLFLFVFVFFSNLLF